MNRSEIKELLTYVEVVKPCAVEWETMTGDERARVCSQCNLTVHNLSALTEAEAAILVKKRKTERTCVFFKTKPDGSVQVDNCPQQLKMVRNKVYGAIAASLMTVALGIYMSSSPTISGAQACFNDIVLRVNDGGQLITGLNGSGREFQYDTARDISRGITFISSLVAFFWPMKKAKKETMRTTIVGLFARLSVPVLIDFAGTFIINNSGGLSGGM